MRSESQWILYDYVSSALSSIYTKSSKKVAPLITACIFWLLLLLSTQAQSDEKICQIIPDTKTEIPEDCQKGDVLEVIGNTTGSQNLKSRGRIFPTAEDKARSWFYQYIGSYCDFQFPIVINNSKSIWDFDKYESANAMWTLNCKYIGYKRTVIEEWKPKN